ncbi:Nad-binding phosphogluconate dehydrogenase-like protein [Mycena venus]|uniref:Nad-binding phosphogluconate dehydrogenase-like protein n=1 Tax=Mycena venus TaxID=2733690 RepID=A0A8H6XJ92_9AGAR|nr:Nad-binding phosphogluconate dehydrogenase-like protein [Mycena venus]
MATNSTSTPTLALLAPGAMGAAIAGRLSSSGAGTILTNLDGRSETTIQRAHASNMQHASYAEIAERASYIYSIVPPQDALAVAESIVSAYKTVGRRETPLVFVDCNAVNPASMKRMAALFDGTGIILLDGVIIGTPPTASYNPGIYVSADSQNIAALDEFTRISNEFGLDVLPLKGEGAGIGDASALKMAHSGIVKGTIGLFTTMILGAPANAASPSTASGLVHALNRSQPTLADLLIRFLPEVIPKAYRFVAEMGEVGGFTATSGAHSGASTFEGLVQIFARVAEANSNPDADDSDLDVLLKFVEEAKEARAAAKRQV